MTGRLFVTGYGAQAVAHLRDLVDEVRTDAPLAAIDVVVPSAFAGMTVRRALAGSGGLVNIRFSSLPQLAERLSARATALSGVAPLDPTARSAALTAASARTPGTLGRVARSPRTAGLVQQVVTELDDAGVDEAALASLGGERGGAELAALYAAYRQHLLGARGGADLVRTAAASVSDGSAPSTHVILYGPRRATAAERELLTALISRSALSAVLCRTGEPDADTDVDALRGALVEAGLVSTGVGPTEQQAAHAGDLVVAPDADEETRMAVRRVLDHLAAGGQPHRVAVAFRSAVPYVRLLSEHLTAAGLPHHVPSTRRLADSLAGRTITGLLELGRRDFPRGEVIRWLGAAPVLDAEGRTVPVRSWDRISRAAGVSGGHATWRNRLSRYATDSSRQERRPEECAQAEALLSFVDELAAAAAYARGAATWPEVARALERATARFLGRRRDVDRWGGRADAVTTRVRAEQDAYDAVLGAVRCLAELHGISDPPTPELVTEALTRALDTSVPSGTVLGRGVHVIPTRAVPGADLDLLLVVGAAEGQLPPRQREHVLLRDAQRRALSDDLRTLADRRRDERHDHLAALASASVAVVSYPRADARSQRGLHVSPWWTGAAETPNLAPPSFVGALRTASTHLSAAERDTAAVMRSGPEALSTLVARYGRGVEASRARRHDAFGPWQGDTGALPPELHERADSALSATSLQTWAACPHRFWLDRVLRVRHHDDPGAEDTISALDRGTLLHAVLEEVMQGAADGGRPPGAAWTTEEIVGAAAVLDRLARELEEQGRTGRPLLWRWELVGLHRRLAEVLAQDSQLRLRHASTPVAVESTFGRDGEDPLVLDLPRSGPVAFGGSIDRVDRTDDGRLVVVDYKSGADRRYESIPIARGGAGAEDDVDLVDRGKKLQLVLYALAARQKHGSPDTEVDAHYWFIEHGVRRGATVTPGHERRLLDVVDVAVQGIRSGVYPARPGAEGRFGWENCGFCAFDRLCSVERESTWNRTRTHARAAEFVALAEEDL